MEGVVGWLLLVLALAVAIGLVVAKVGGSKYLEAVFGALGTARGEDILERRRRKRAGEVGRFASTLAALRTQPAGDRAAIDSSGPRTSFVPGLDFLPGPFAGARPVFLFVGADAEPLAVQVLPKLDALEAHREVMVVQQGGLRPSTSQILRFSGSLMDQIGDALRRADHIIGHGEADYLAVILRLPLSGSFLIDQDSSGALIGEVLDSSRNVWLTWLEPLQLSEFSEDVYLDYDGSASQLEGLISAAAPSMRSPDRVGALLRYPRRDACTAILALVGDKNGLLISEVDEHPPEYHAQVQLLLGRAAQRELRARVDLANNKGSLVSLEGVSIREVGDGATGDRLASDLLKQKVAWLIVDRGQPERPAEPSRQMNNKQLLQEAIQIGDGHLAASALVNSGRAWLEEHEVVDNVALIERARVHFGAGSLAGIWAQFLVWLDSMLRLGVAAEGAFGEESIDHARSLGVEHLFRGEAMEFARVRGDLSEACRHAQILVEGLREPVAAAPSLEARYSVGTAYFLLNNLCRRGGRYDLAESWARLALQLLEPITPSLETEHLHCQYALGVCASIQGRPVVQDLSTASAASHTFARGLVTLNNAVSLWLLSDAEAARAEASQAISLFEPLGYLRYANRARDIVEHLELWEQLASGNDECLSNSKWALLRVLVGASAGASVDLSHMRPSRALGILALGREFGGGNDEVHIDLPAILQFGDEIKFASAPPVTGVGRADSELRRLMGIGPEVKVPLVID